MSKYISSTFKKDDYVKLKEDLHSDVYDITFNKGHEFRVVEILPKGLVIEDKEGYRLMNTGFLRFEVTKKRGDYRENHSYGWYSYKP